MEHEPERATSKDARLSIAVVGAGMGGLTVAGILLRSGHDVTVYEQARAFSAVGAGIQLTANANRALRPLGLVDRLRRVSFFADAAYNREWDSGRITNILPLGKALEERYGEPDLMMHRGALHAALLSLVPESCLRLEKKLVGLDRRESMFTLRFADGSSATADAVIGADGIHSAVREILFGPEKPRFIGRVAYRTTYPASILDGAAIDGRCKWWGPDSHIVHYYTTNTRDEVYFIAVTPEPDFEVESWSARGDRDRLLEAYAGYHPTALRILGASPEIRKWALVEREPMKAWGEERIVLLGDACHPMMPFMAQGAASAIEDAVVLARCLQGMDADGVATAFRRYQSNRRERTARIQLTNRQNTWLKQKTDTDWVYEYDAWNVALGD
ncbi:MAG: salicylate 1-monooxygenase [Betaproteobacteria bacterium]|nr:salicylate 1-monooxygenase [Betaproteobacteria bacterium]